MTVLLSALLGFVVVVAFGVMSSGRTHASGAHSVKKAAPRELTPDVKLALSVVKDPQSRVRAQQMTVGNPAVMPPTAAIEPTTGRVAIGAAFEPPVAVTEGLRTQLSEQDLDVQEPSRYSSHPDFVVRFANDQHRIDLMVSSTSNDVLLQMDHQPIGLIDLSSSSSQLETLRKWFVTVAPTRK